MEGKERSVCEEQVFSTIYEEHYTTVRNFIYYKNGNLDKAEDIAQEAFIKIWNNCKDVIYTTVKSYLFTISNRIFLNTVRHEKVKLNFNKAHTQQQQSETPESITIEKEFKDTLEKAIANLSDKNRTVFLLNRIDGKKYKEIALLLGVSVKTVEKRMSDALKQLKNDVEELKIFKI
ncbi:MAG: RNA polymerase sigma factor [Flavobacteriaceae bacterium]